MKRTDWIILISSLRITLKNKISGSTGKKGAPICYITAAKFRETLIYS